MMNDDYIDYPARKERRKRRDDGDFPPHVKTSGWGVAGRLSQKRRKTTTTKVVEQRQQQTYSSLGSIFEEVVTSPRTQPNTPSQTPPRIRPRNSNSAGNPSSSLIVDDTPTASKIRKDNKRLKTPRSKEKSTRTTKYDNNFEDDLMEEVEDSSESPIIVNAPTLSNQFIEHLVEMLKSENLLMATQVLDVIIGMDFQKKGNQHLVNAFKNTNFSQNLCMLLKRNSIDSTAESSSSSSSSSTIYKILTLILFLIRDHPENDTNSYFLKQFATKECYFTIIQRMKNQEDEEFQIIALQILRHSMQHNTAKLLTENDIIEIAKIFRETSKNHSTNKIIHRHVIECLTNYALTSKKDTSMMNFINDIFIEMGFMESLMMPLKKILNAANINNATIIDDDDEEYSTERILFSLEMIGKLAKDEIGVRRFLQENDGIVILANIINLHKSTTMLSSTVTAAIIGKTKNNIANDDYKKLKSLSFQIMDVVYR